jgi:hypothetical protein
MQNLMGIHSRKMTKYAVILSQHHLKCGGKKKERGSSISEGTNSMLVFPPCIFSFMLCCRKLGKKRKEKGRACQPFETQILSSIEIKHLQFVYSLQPTQILQL